MRLRKNYPLFYFLEVLSGILILILTQQFGNWGLLGSALFFLALILTQGNPDEREMAFMYRINSYHGAFMGAVMAILYFKFPQFNWFYGVISFGAIIRGVIGMIVFKKG